MAFLKITDTLTPDLRRRVAQCGDKRPLLEAMGQAVKSLSAQAFTDASKRPSYWAPRKDNYPHPLLMGHHSQGGSSPPMMWRTIRVTGFTSDSVLVGSDRPYAATHQLGRDHIPARPFMPFYKSGQMTALGKQKTDRALRAVMTSRGWQ